MGFNKDLDVAVGEWERKDEDSGTVLQVSVRRYNDGDPKLQVGPRTFTNNKGEEKFRKAGRLSEEESLWLLSLSDSIKDAFAG